jgi:protein-disulfide isomerase
VADAQATINALEAQLAMGAATPEAPAVMMRPTGDGGFLVGDSNAPVTIVEFADFACPHCIDYKDEVMDRFIEEYVLTGQAAYEFRALPTAGGAQTAFAAEFAFCAEAERPGAFWEAHEFFYEAGSRPDYMQSSLFRRAAEALDLNLEALQACSLSGTTVVRNIELAEQLGVFGTPAVLVRYDGGDPAFITLDGRTYEGGGVPLEILAEVVEAAQE